MSELNLPLALVTTRQVAVVDAVRISATLTREEVVQAKNVLRTASNLPVTLCKAIHNAYDAILRAEAELRNA